MENIIDLDFRIPYAWYPRTSDRISWEVRFHYPVKMCPSKIKIGKIAHREILFECQLVEQFRSLSTFQQTCRNTNKSTLFPFSGFANRENHPKFVLTKGQIILNGQKMGEINCNHEYYRPRDCLKYECSYNIRTREGEVE